MRSCGTIDLLRATSWQRHLRNLSEDRDGGIVRAGFMRTLLDVAEQDTRVEFVVADLGFGVIEPFVERYPDRFLNVGVAEQNMTGVAVGLALTGSVVFTYSIANFPTLRCLEQLRNDACYHGANVKVVAVGGGLAYGALGMSHHATEDLAILRCIPGLAVAAPGDPHEAAAITRTAAAVDGPVYVRLGKSGEPNVHGAALDLPVGSSVEVVSGADIAILTTGGMLRTAVDVAEALSSLGLEARVVSMPWIQPLDAEAVLRAAAEVTLVVTLEEHSVRGGLGGAVAEFLAEEPFAAPLFRIGIPPGFAPLVGSHQYLLGHYGLDVRSVTHRIVSRVKQGGEGGQHGPRVSSGA
jgi:transketolase